MHSPEHGSVGPHFCLAMSHEQRCNRSARVLDGITNMLYPKVSCGAGPVQYAHLIRAVEVIQIPAEISARSHSLGIPQDDCLLDPLRRLSIHPRVLVPIA